MREYEEKLKSVHSSRALRLDLVTSESPKKARVKHAGELKSHTSWSTTRQNFQFSQAVSSQLKLATYSSRKLESLDSSVC